MNSDQFSYWLQGFFEMTESNKLSENQVKMIKEHLKLVFHKITPQLKPTESNPLIPFQENKFWKDYQERLDKEMAKFGTGGTYCGLDVKLC